jgi:hypothetical protein
MSSTRTSCRAALCAGLLVALAATAARAQLLPESGSNGLVLVHASSPGGLSQMQMINPSLSLVPQPWGAAVAAVPSRWAHRRRTLGGLEVEIAWAPPKVWLTPMGDAVGNGAIHLVDARGAAVPASVLVPTGNPAAYDLALVTSLRQVYSAEDTGLGTTRLRGFSYATPGTLVPLSPAWLDLPGAPAAYVNRMGLDADALALHVPTASGVQVVQLAAAAPHMAAGPFLSTLPSSPATNPLRFVQAGAPTWIVGTGNFALGVGFEPLSAGWLAWTDKGAVGAADFGAVPSSPGKEWVPAVGAEELAVVGDGGSTFVYSLLREPKPGTFFIKGSAIGVVRFAGVAPPVTSTILLSDACGEPFGVPEVFAGRVAFETSFGPPFILDPADGGERVCVLYSPLDPVGAGSADGVVGVAAPLGGRISTRGMDRPIWSEDGTRLFAASSWFPGAPSVGLPGLEILDVPAGLPVNEWTGPHTLVPTLESPDQSIVFPGVFRPRDPGVAALWSGTTVVGHVAHDGMAAAFAVALAEVGQKQLEARKLVQAAGVPGFPSILPSTFGDTGVPALPPPPVLGARRVTFNLVPGLSLVGLVMYAADGDRLLLQATGYETLAELGFAPPLGRVALPLPAGWITSTEFLSL